jgi:cytochrome c556
MRVMLALGCSAALFAVAACNREDAPANSSAESGTNVSANASANAAAPTPAPADVALFMHDRHERYEHLGDMMKGINRELKGDAPSIDTIRRNASQIAAFSTQVPMLFPHGTGPESGHRTRAKAEIWSDPDTFRQRARAFETEAARFNQAAQSGDLAAVRAAQPGLADACKNCHERFRTREGGHR